MYKIGLIADSTCDLPDEILQNYEIELVPLTINWGENQYLDRVELKAEDFYSRLSVDPVYPTTSQPAPSAFLDAYKKAEARGYEEIITYTLSSAMSGTINSARIAAENSPIPVRVVDSKTNSMGLGWQILSAARARDKGLNAEQMIARSEEVRKSMNYIISLDTLEYLLKGGRIGGAAKFIGSVLKIKPQIYVNHETGKVEAGIPGRSREKAINALSRDFFNRIDTSKVMHICVLHNAAYDEAEALTQKIIQEYQPAEIFIQIVSPILGVHTGPRAIALCGYAEN